MTYAPWRSRSTEITLASEESSNEDEEAAQREPDDRSVHRRVGDRIAAISRRHGAGVGPGDRGARYRCPRRVRPLNQTNKSKQTKQAGTCGAYRAWLLSRGVLRLDCRTGGHSRGSVDDK